MRESASARAWNDRGARWTASAAIPSGRAALSAAAQRLGIEVCARREAHHLRERVDARVGPGRHRERSADPGRRERVLEGGLHRREPRLPLEPAEPATLVRDLDGIEASLHAC